MPSLSILYYYYYCYILPHCCNQFENSEAPDFEKNCFRFQLHFRFRFRFRFQPLSSKCFRFHKKLTASAFTSLVNTQQVLPVQTGLYYNSTMNEWSKNLMVNTLC